MKTNANLKHVYLLVLVTNFSVHNRGIGITTVDSIELVHRTEEEVLGWSLQHQPEDVYAEKAQEPFVYRIDSMEQFKTVFSMLVDDCNMEMVMRMEDIEDRLPELL